VVVAGSKELTARVDGGEPISLRLTLSAAEREVLAAGGLLRMSAKAPAAAPSNLVS
jgi:hypothetical protein